MTKSSDEIGVAGGFIFPMVGTELTAKANEAAENVFRFALPGGRTIRDVKEVTLKPVDEQPIPIASVERLNADSAIESVVLKASSAVIRLVEQVSPTMTQYGKTTGRAFREISVGREQSEDMPMVHSWTGNPETSYLPIDAAEDTDKQAIVGAYALMGSGQLVITDVQ